MQVSKNTDKILAANDLTGATLWKSRRHLLDSRDMSTEEIQTIMAVAGRFKRRFSRHTAPLAILTNRILANVFYENSTRTRSSFELAARQLGMTVLNLDVASSSVSKGESLIDTAKTLAAMGVSVLVQRHTSYGAAQQVAEIFDEQLHVMNAGDGWNAHPTQGLLDLFTMLEALAHPGEDAYTVPDKVDEVSLQESVELASLSDMEGKKVAIIGDIKHSRVARSNLWLLKTAGAEVHFAGPPALLPQEIEDFGAKVHYDLEPAIKDADFVMALRLQLERQQQSLIPSLTEYSKLFRLDHERIKLAKRNVKVLHPGPINRGVEITSELADDPTHSLITTQVTNGVVVRMAALYLLLQEDAV